MIHNPHIENHSVKYAPQVMQTLKFKYSPLIQRNKNPRAQSRRLRARHSCIRMHLLGQYQRRYRRKKKKYDDRGAIQTTGGGVHLDPHSSPLQPAFQYPHFDESRAVPHPPYTRLIRPTKSRFDLAPIARALNRSI